MGQSLEVQLDKLVGCPCDKTYHEKKSGPGGGGKRPGVDTCLEYLRVGDTLVITRLDRLARSTLHLCQIAAELQVLDQQIDTAISTGRLLFHMLRVTGDVRSEPKCYLQAQGDTTEGGLADQARARCNMGKGRDS